MRSIHFLKIIIGLLTFFSLQQCAQQEVAGGSVGETTNGITALVQDSTGKGVMAKIRVYTANSGLQDEFYTSEKGEFYLLNRDNIPFHFDVKESKQGLRAWIWNQQNNQNPRIIRVSQPSQVPIKLQDSLINTLCLTGSPYCSLKDTAGIFSFDSIPYGAWTLESPSFNLPLGSIYLNPGINPLIQLPLADGLLLDDFNDGDGVHLLHAYTGPVNWFTEATKAQLNNITDNQNLTDVMENTEAYAGRSLHLQYTLEQDGFIFVATRFKSNNNSINLSNLQSIKLFMKGTGVGEVTLEQGLKENNYLKVAFDFTLTNSWQEFTFQPGDASNQYPEAVTLDSIGTEIRLFSIFLREGSEVWIDNIRFTGVNLNVIK